MPERELTFIAEELPEGGWTAGALGYAIHTEGVDLVEIRRMVIDAVRCHFDVSELPRVVRLRGVRDEDLAV